MLPCFRMNLLSVSISRWRFYVTLRQEEKEQEMTSDVHYAANILSKYFSLWTEYTQLQKWKNAAVQQAKDFYR